MSLNMEFNICVRCCQTRSLHCTVLFLKWTIDWLIYLVFNTVSTVFYPFNESSLQTICSTNANNTTINSSISALFFFLPMYSTRITYTKSNVVMTCVFVDWWEIYPYQWRPRSRPRGSRRQRESRHDCDGITWFGNNPEDAVRKRQFLRHVSCVSSGHCLPAIVQRTSISYYKIGRLFRVDNQ